MEKVSEITISYRPEKGIQENPIIHNAKDAYGVLLPHFNPSTIAAQEQFIICYLSRSNQVKGVYPAFLGGITGTVADIRIILAVALKSFSSSIIIAHNHPSGTLTPSRQDIQITQELIEAARILDMEMLDHIIITQDSYRSMRDNNDARF